MVMDANWYSCHIGVISRSQVRTAVGAAAYITGTKLYDRELEASPNYEPSDYTRKGGVEQWFITALERAPEWAFDINALTNEAQARDTRRNSCTARVGRFALPSEADMEGREHITHEVADFLAEHYGVAVIASIHAPDRHGDDRNWHAHLWFTTREIGGNGLGAKTRVLDDKKTGPQEIIRIREAVADIINDYLEDAGIDERVDHRSYKDRGIDRTPMIYLGEAASALERQGIRTERGDRNRAIRESNRRIDQLTGEIAALQAERVRELESAFLELEPEIEDSPFPIVHEEPQQQEPEFALSWEEEKARAQDMTNADVAGAIKDPVAVYEPDSNFAFLAAREPVPDVPPLTWEERMQKGQDIFSSEILQEAEKQVREHGEVKEYGLGNHWYDRTVASFEDLYYNTMQGMKDTLERLKSRFWDRDNGPGRG